MHYIRLASRPITPFSYSKKSLSRLDCTEKRRFAGRHGSWRVPHSMHLAGYRREGAVPRGEKRFLSPALVSEV